MKNYALLIVQKEIKIKFKAGLPLDICVVTYNRLPYLQKCIWSIIANTSVVNRLTVRDDGSTDGTKEWLAMMKKRGLIHNFIDGKNIGTANSINEAVNRTSSNPFVIMNDDMYLFRYWDFAAIDIYMDYKKAGLVTFYDFARLGLDEGMKVLSETTRQVIRTGMGCTLVNRELFNRVKGFNLPANKKMGYFASTFCDKANRTNIVRRIHYATIPNYAVHMDHPQHKLCERNQLTEYSTMRAKNKTGRTTAEYKNDFGEENV